VQIGVGKIRAQRYRAAELRACEIGFLSLDGAEIDAPVSRNRRKPCFRVGSCQRRQFAEVRIRQHRAG